MPGIDTTRLPHTDYYLRLGELETKSGKGNRKTILASYTTLNHVLKNCCRQYEVKLNRINIDHTRLTQGHLISRNK